ncbi:MAG TPA: tetratricopeptide repeat protein [Burkholderiales bacterium]|jgi:MSHA biogenesis protein MshN|nr:tetratricopeptide repeat protein [Burkholderiales bacterium]
MSLINQVLQDLEKRHASEPELKSLPPHVRAVANGRRSLPAATYAWIAAAIVAVAAVALYFGGWLKPAPVTQVAVAPVPGPAPAVQASAPAVLPAGPAVQTFVPASRLSDELSFVPEAAIRKEPAPPAPRPDSPRSVAPKPPPAAPGPPQIPAAVEPAAPKAAAAPEARAPEPAPAAPAPAPVAAPEPGGSIDKQVREMTAQQKAELAFRKGVAQLQEARAAAAEADFREALREDATHVAARQALLGLLLDAKRNREAEELLRQALEINPRQPRHAMVLARLQVDRGEVSGAINTLVAALPYVQSDAEYYAFLAALLQREGRHRETIDYYRAALRASPGNAVWLMGLGISLRATSQYADAREVFQGALNSNQLSGDLRAFTERQLRELNAPKK